ncbi:hypothetical protein ACPOL_2366 [Acidisarcina polymorpha]|uniref:Uncharacterized protein n=1 Tax=Acidisarcina polymorpha TaxID=2211140 RepID=A0A2Z5FY98_9BACT|nr:hypothetical protein ACPOL_2366 [Acidisarcina polymorpha]
MKILRVAYALPLLRNSQTEKKILWNRLNLYGHSAIKASGLDDMRIAPYAYRKSLGKFGYFVAS